ncbi:MAG: 4Fe-4S cluster-binding domain-containing protein, partial [Novosphingobium sp.]|nr:4Fe-4S cluster-binding domain-containing protein [Novosphingobium sp.]
MDYELLRKSIYVYEYHNNYYFVPYYYKFQIFKISSELYEKVLLFIKNGSLSDKIVSLFSFCENKSGKTNTELGSIRDVYPFEDKNIKSLFIQFCIDNKCPLQCKYCFAKNEKYNDSNNIFSNKNMFIDYFSKIVLFFLNKHPYVEEFNFSFNLSGEPLVHYEYFKIFISLLDYYEKTTGKIFNKSCLTNAYLINKNNISWLNENIKFFGISLDGPKKVHDKLRVTKSGHKTYNKINSNIRKLLSLNWTKPIGISVTITNENINVFKVFKYLVDRGFKSICMKRVRLPNDHSLSINNYNVDKLILYYR